MSPNPHETDVATSMQRYLDLEALAHAVNAEVGQALVAPETRGADLARMGFPSREDIMNGFYLTRDIGELSWCGLKMLRAQLRARRAYNSTYPNARITLAEVPTFARLMVTPPSEE